MVELALTALLLGGCSDAAGGPLPAPPANVGVLMSEFRIGSQPAEVREGRVVFDVTNRGEVGHQLTIFRIPEGVRGTLNEQLRSPRRVPASPLAVLPTLKPRQGTSIALDLRPGRYGLVCFLKDPGGSAHALLGMSAELRVR